jgi:hypothetical protein
VKPILTAFLLIFVVACASTKEVRQGTLTLDLVMRLSFDRDSENSIVSALGAPDVRVNVPDSSEVLWSYNDKIDGYQRLSLVFDETGRLQSKVWLVREREPEILLENSQKRFPSAKFVAEDVQWDNSHSAPDERFYSDEENGISILFRKTRQEVESIGWYRSDIVIPTASQPNINSVF